MLLNFVLNINSTAGIRKAKLLPEPVFALPKISYPCKASGMHRDCISEAFSNLNLVSIAFSVCSCNPKSLNFVLEKKPSIKSSSSTLGIIASVSNSSATTSDLRVSLLSFFSY